MYKYVSEITWWMISLYTRVKFYWGHENLALNFISSYYRGYFQITLLKSKDSI